MKRDWDQRAAVDTYWLLRQWYQRVVRDGEAMKDRKRWDECKEQVILNRLERAIDAIGLELLERSLHA